MWNTDFNQEDHAKAAALFADYAPRPVDRPRPALPQGILIRHGEWRDVEALGRILGQREGVDQVTAVARVNRWFDLPAETNLLLVADNSGEPIGYGRAAFVVKPQEPGFEHVPAGWYLTGVIVDKPFRRRGIGELLTGQRLAWIFHRSDAAYFFANSLNLASIELHRRLGFEEVQRDFTFPGASFGGGGVGILYRLGRPSKGPSDTNI